MNYGKKGVRAKQKRLNSKSVKVGKMFLLAFFKAFLFCLIGVAVVGLCFGIGVFRGILSSAPDISNIDVTPSGYATYVYDNKGNQIKKLVAENSNRSYVGMESIPQDLSDAFVAIEDERFYDHNGIDIKGIVRAGVQAVRSRGLTEGASTITQQLLKNNVFENWTNETTFQKIERKLQEQYLALELEKQLGDQAKTTILELYMNSINLGQQTLGVQAASMRYFNKPVSQLTLSECAVIASITQNPTRLNPISHPTDNATRREKVLGNMLEQGYISQSEYDTAMADDVYARIQSVNAEIPATTVNSYFIDELTEQVVEDLKELLGYNDTQAYNLLYRGGLQIYTTQDPDIQTICDEVYSNEENYPSNVKWYLNCELTFQNDDGTFQHHSREMLNAYFLEKDRNFSLNFSSQDDAYAAVDEYKQQFISDTTKLYAESVTLIPQPQVSITIQDQHTGYVVAMVGGRGEKTASLTLNRATNTLRLPGSTFKVLSTYAPALDSAGLTLASVQNDAPYTYEDGTPVRNYEGENVHHGLCSLRRGIQDSLNIVTVKTLTQITPQLGFDYLQNFGFTSLVDRMERVNPTTGRTEIYTDIQQPLALGGITLGVSNLELNAAYASIANNGTYIKPTLYTKIVDHDGNVLIDNSQPPSHQVIKETTAFLLTDAMVDVVTQGTGTSVNFGNMAIAGKTGTTTGYDDVWFSGYTPYYTATTWTGFDDNTGLSTPAERALSRTLWRAVMSRIHEDLPNESFTRPPGIVTATVCKESGKLPIEGTCTNVISDYFAEGTVPTEYCDVHVFGLVCSQTGMPADSICPFQTPGVPTVLIPNEEGTGFQTCPHTLEYIMNPTGAPPAPPTAPTTP